MRFTALLVMFTALVGCGQKGGSGTNDTGAGRTSFDTAGFTASTNWLRGKVGAYEETRRGKNQLATQSALQEFNSDLAQHVGKRVTWKVPVDRVEGDSVHFLSVALAEPDSPQRAVKNLPVWLVVTAVKESELPAELKSYDGPAFGRAVIGQAITKGHATQLRHGDEAYLFSASGGTRCSGTAADRVPEERTSVSRHPLMTQTRNTSITHAQMRGNHRTTRECRSPRIIPMLAELKAPAIDPTVTTTPTVKAAMLASIPRGLLQA